MDAILHVGVTKTGTTTIQKFLRDNRDALRRQGIVVPVSSMARDHFGQHIGLPALLASRAGDETHAAWLARTVLDAGADLPSALEEMWEAFRRELGEAEDGRLAILSSEGLTRFGRRELADLAGLLAPLFGRVRVLVYLRRQDLHAVSLFNSIVRTEVPVTDLFPDPPLPYHHFDVLLGDLAHAFGSENIEVRLFEAERMKDGDSLADFRAVCGIADDPAFAVPERQNERLTAKQAAFLHFLQQANGGRVLPPMQLRAVLDTLECGDCFMPARAEAEAYYRRFAEGNAAIARDYLGREGPLFDEDFSFYPQEAAISDFISVEDMAGAMIAHLARAEKIRRKERQARQDRARKRQRRAAREKRAKRERRAARALQ